MSQDFTTPIPPLDAPYTEPPKKRNTVLIVVIVVLVLLCCCCLVASGLLGTWLWNNGDQLIDDLDLTMVAPFLQMLA